MNGVLTKVCRSCMQTAKYDEAWMIVKGKAEKLAEAYQQRVGIYREIKNNRPGDFIVRLESAGHPAGMFVEWANPPESPPEPVEQKEDPNLITALAQLRQAGRILNRLVKAKKNRHDKDARSKLMEVEALCNVVIMRVR